MVGGITGGLLDLLVTFGKELLLPFLTLLFVTAIGLRFLVYWTIKREHWFVGEFDRRLQRYLTHENPHGKFSFVVVLKKIMERTFYELFQNRSVLRRRKLDHLMEPSDRFFLIQTGSAHLVRDTVKYASTLRKGSDQDEKEELIEVSKQVLSQNPVFNRLFGFIPIGPLNDFLNLLPGLFIVGGIFGTFLGIMKALPELQGMNPADAEGTKLIMDDFLIKIAFSMSTSTMGILYSVIYSVYCSFINPEKLFVKVVNQYEHTLSQLWRRSESNELPSNLPQFDENRDPTEALAELALQKELSAFEEKKKKKDPSDGRESVVPPPHRNKNDPGDGDQAA